MTGSRRFALVTGGNRGIGLEVVKLLLRRDFVVFLGCRDAEAGAKAAGSAEAAALVGGEPRAIPVVLEVRDPESVAAAVAAVRARLGGRRLDLLVNNAGVLPEADAEEFCMERVRETLEVNFEGAVAVTEAFLPLLLTSSTDADVEDASLPQVLLTSSSQGARCLGLLREEHRALFADEALDLPQLRRALEDVVAQLRESEYRETIPTVGYSLSKLAVNCYAQVLSRELAGRARANAVSPGFCNTGMCANYTGARKPKAPELGASVFDKVLFGELGRDATGAFFKEASKADTPLEQAVSARESWIL